MMLLYKVIKSLSTETSLAHRRFVYYKCIYDILIVFKESYAASVAFKMQETVSSSLKYKQLEWKIFTMNILQMNVLKTFSLGNLMHD